MKGISKVTKKEKGWTMVELLFVMSIFAVILAGIFQLFQWATDSWRRSYYATLAREEATRALQRMSKDLREATPINDDPALYYANSQQLIFFSNVDSDSEPEKVEYILSGSDLLRKVTQPDSTQTPYTYNNNTPEVTTLTSYCRNNSNEPLFIYYASTTQTLTSVPLSSADLENVKIIKIQLKIDVNLQQPPAAKFWTVEVTLRNVD